jgi:heme exporter protein B
VSAVRPSTARPSTARLTWVLLRKDLRIAARSREVLGFMLLFALLCVIVFAFGFLREGQAAEAEVPGVLWVTLLFSGTVGLLRLFAAEDEGGTLEATLRSARGSLPLFASKTLLQLLFSGIVTALLVPVVVVFFTARLQGLGWVALALALGLLGQALLGTLCAALLVHVRLREVLLPLVLYPLLAPVLIAGVQVTALAQQGATADGLQGWLWLMLGFDVLIGVLAPWLHARVPSP